MPENTHIQAIAAAVIDGDAHASSEATQSALASNVDPLLILNEGLMGGADEVGKRFERGEYFLPELMLAGRALKAAMQIVKPSLLEKYSGADSQVKGKVVSATVQTDIHDIGKNIVSFMLDVNGFRSQISIFTVSCVCNTFISIRVSVGEYFTALSKRLTKACPKRAKSIETSGR